MSAEGVVEGGGGGGGVHGGDVLVQGSIHTTQLRACSDSKGHSQN